MQLRRTRILSLVGACCLAGLANAQTLCPDGSWVGGDECRLAPDGSWVDDEPKLAPDGSWVGGEPELAPDGSWVGGD